ncbi:gliding motility-associated C-terminal domain-containing protein [Formosa sp. L2A11]|uniref:DUF7507 domain-containing protein n=1 Tax=Formosa sp. L2A11 TaxID=2686363 RepID=UPI00131CC953|nr:gliding motility-associated C-terminal domain-containing protein [Formosa sp. L2A11]
MTNTGNVTLTNISISDALVSVTGSLASLAPGASDSTTFTATYTITQLDIDSGSVTNQATVTGTDPEGDSVSDLSDDPTDATNVDANGDGEPDDATVTGFSSSSSMSLEKTGTFNDVNGNGFTDAGETITYGFKVTNTGNVTLTNISISDALVSVTGSLASLAPGASDSTTFTATYTITQSDVDSGSVSNQATVTGTDPEGTSVSDLSDDPTDATNVDANGDGEPDDATVTEFSGSNGGISLEKTATFNDANGNGFTEAGETITYGFVVKNMGNVTLTNISISDPLVSVTGSLASLAPGASDSTTFTATYTITQADVNSGRVTNQATVTGNDPAGDSVSDLSDDPTDATNIDANGDGEPDDATVTVFNTNSAISLLKEGTYNKVTKAITYVFTVKNTGSVTLTNITIEDPLLGGTLDSSIASLEPGESDNTTFVISYSVVQDDLDLGYVINTALAVADDAQGNTIYDTSGTDFDNDDVTDTDLDITPPDAYDDEAETTLDESVSIPILDNDVAYDTELICSTIQVVDQPQYGTVEVTADCEVIYTPDPNIKYTGDDYFTYMVQDGNGRWTNEATVTISISGLFIPNVITPNKDGDNDTFEIIGLEFYNKAQVLIFNRWGNEVYRNSDYSNSNGFSGEGLNKGTYYYHIKLTDKQGGVKGYDGWLYIKE